MFGDTVVAAALLDRLLHHAIVIEIAGNSYRLREHAKLVPDSLRPPLVYATAKPKKRRGRPRKKHQNETNKLEKVGEITSAVTVIERTDDYVDIPFGAVGLYWLRQYLPLVLHHRLPQRASGPDGYSWAKEAFHRLRAVSPSDLRLGARFDTDRAVILTRALNDACGNIEKMPVRYITHPGSANRQLFDSGFRRVRATAGPIVLSREYLAQFGRFRIPTQLW